MRESAQKLKDKNSRKLEVEYCLSDQVWNRAQLTAEISNELYPNPVAQENL